MTIRPFLRDSIQNTRLASGTLPLLYTVFMLVLMGALLVWQAHTRIRDFGGNQRQVAAASVTGVVNEIHAHLLELRRSVNLFANERSVQLFHLAENPGDTRTYAQLEAAVQQYFPGMFAFTLSDVFGEILLEQRPEMVGDTCRLDIQRFATEGHRQNVQVHPHPLGAHFDIMVPVFSPDEVEDLVFFVSFEPDELRRVLANAQPPAHRLYLLLKEGRRGLIDVSAEGWRTTEPGTELLSASDLRRVLSRAPVPDTRWEVVDVPQPALFASQAERSWTQAGALFLGMVAISVAMLLLLWRSEARRAVAERALQRHHLELAHVDRLSIMGELASTLAHELNQPLGAVVNYSRASLRLIRDGCLDKERLVPVLEASADQAQRAGEVLHKVRDFVRKGSHVPVCTDLVELIRETLELGVAEMRSKGGRIEVYPAQQLPRVRCDRIQIKQVVLNLVFNAIEAMEAAGSSDPCITIRLAAMQGTAVRVSIRDNGPGVDGETAQRLFEPFFSTKREGMGLGLAICRTIIEAHSGHIGLEQVNGRGASFVFTLPIDEECNP